MKLNQHLIVPALLGVVLVAQAADQPWFTRHLVGMEVGPTGVQFGHSDFNDVRCAARFDGRELDSTDNWVRFGKRDFGTETERKQRTSPAVSSKTLRSELQSPLCLQGSAKPAQNSAERNLRFGESRRKIVVSEPDGKKLSVTRTGSKARLPEQPQNRRTRPAE